MDSRPRIRLVIVHGFQTSEQNRTFLREFAEHKSASGVLDSLNPIE